MNEEIITILKESFKKIEELQGNRLRLRELEETIIGFCSIVSQTGYISNDDEWFDEMYFYTDCFYDYEPTDVIFGAPCSKGLLNSNDTGENFFEVQFTEDCPGERDTENFVTISFAELRL